MKRLALSILPLLSLSCTASTGEKEEPKADRMANPAVEKCLADGLKVEPQFTNGAPTSYLCIDATKGIRCDAWAYFRGECPSEQSNHQ